MSNGNHTYKAIVAYINSLGADRHEIQHAIVLIAAQMAHAPPNLIQVFLYAEGKEMEDTHEQLPRLNGMVDPNSTITRSMVEEQPESHMTDVPDVEDRPIVQMWVHPHIEAAYQANKNNMKTLCSFHNCLPPQEKDFTHKGATELTLTMSYGHVDGGFVFHFFSDGDAYLQLFGEFSIESFMTVRIELINQP